MLDGTEKAAREPKHIELDRAIESIYQIKEYAEDIFGQIVGKDEKEVPSLTGETLIHKIPSLQELLEKGSSRIIQVNDEVRKVLDQIKSVLF